MAVWLTRLGRRVNRKRVQRLMRIMGLRTIYRRPRTSCPAPGHKVYPYLLQGMEITRPNQVWATDITYIPMARGFLYLVAIMDWFSRCVLAWSASGGSNTLDADFHFYNTQRPHQALGYRTPAEVFNYQPGGASQDGAERRCLPGAYVVTYRGAAGPSRISASPLSD